MQRQPHEWSIGGILPSWKPAALGRVRIGVNLDRPLRTVGRLIS
jgi:hypothetical protein